MVPSLTFSILCWCMWVTRRGVVQGYCSLTTAQHLTPFPPQRLSFKLRNLGLNACLYELTLGFLICRPQVVRVEEYTSNTIVLNTGVPQGCMLSLLLHSLYSHYCVALHRPNSIVKFAENMVVLGLITNNNDRAYMEEVEHLSSWCLANCLQLRLQD